VLVIKAGQTRREAVQRALEILRAGNAQIAGMVLNQRTFPVPQALYERL
jgi:Mrp family chromosome partitioning ATPase